MVQQWPAWVTVPAGVDLGFDGRSKNDDMARRLARCSSLKEE
jgi:hypothetical protein